MIFLKLHFIVFLREFITKHTRLVIAAFCILAVLLLATMCNILFRTNVIAVTTRQHLVENTIVTRQYNVKVNDNIQIVLFNNRINAESVNAIIASIHEYYSGNDIKLTPKQIITFTYEIHKDHNPLFVTTNISEPELILKSISFDKNHETQIIIRHINGSYVVDEKSAHLKKTLRRVFGKITDSLYSDAVAMGMPPNIVMSMIDMYSFDLDFQRDIMSGDTFSIIFEDFISEETGKSVKVGNILYSSYNPTFGKKIEYFYFSKLKQHFDINGSSLRKSLMKTPINGARLSSGFGFRKHPILGYSKLHKGVDFAAPKGTPIFAAGNGTIEYRGRFSTYGNYIRIRHNADYSTAYAHMSAFEKNFSIKSKVSQGQIIGYVGSTGSSTGPHLHYEITKHGKQINPLNLKMPPSKALKKAELREFLTEVRTLKNSMPEESYTTQPTTEKKNMKTMRKSKIPRTPHK